MRSRALHIALALLLLSQTVSAHVWLDMASEPADAPMVSCHDAPEAAAPEPEHGCCDEMDSATCLLACASVAAAFATPDVLPESAFHAAENTVPNRLHSSAQPRSIYRPPSIS